MKDVGHVLHGGGQGGEILDVAADDFEIGAIGGFEEMFHSAGREIIEDGDVGIGIGGEAAGEVTADESGASGDEVTIRRLHPAEVSLIGGDSSKVNGAQGVPEGWIGHFEMIVVAADRDEEGHDDGDGEEGRGEADGLFAPIAGEGVEKPD